MGTTLKSLSEQLATFQALMLDSQAKVQTSLSELKTEVKGLGNEIKLVAGVANEAKALAQQNKEEIDSLKKQYVDLSDRNRRGNLIFFGITEEVLAKDLEQSLVDWLSVQGIEIETEDIERSHRLRTRGRGGEPRPVIVKFAREKVQERIYRSLKKTKDLIFKGKKVFVKQDFSQETIRQRDHMKPFAQKLFQSNIKFCWGYPASLITYRDGKRHCARNPEEAKKLLETLGVDMRSTETTGMELELLDSGEGPATHQEKRPRTSSK